MQFLKNTEEPLTDTKTSLCRRLYSSYPKTALLKTNSQKYIGLINCLKSNYDLVVTANYFCQSESVSLFRKQLWSRLLLRWYDASSPSPCLPFCLPAFVTKDSFVMKDKQVANPISLLTCLRKLMDLEWSWDDVQEPMS